jgi:hypothetical protein
MKAYDWFKVVISLFIWIFTWTLVDMLLKLYKIRNDTIMKICVGGLLIIFLIIQMNPDINIS